MIWIASHWQMLLLILYFSHPHDVVSDLQCHLKQKLWPMQSAHQHSFSAIKVSLMIKWGKFCSKHLRISIINSSTSQLTETSSPLQFDASLSCSKNCSTSSLSSIFHLPHLLFSTLLLEWALWHVSQRKWILLVVSQHHSPVSSHTAGFYSVPITPTFAFS